MRSLARERPISASTRNNIWAHFTLAARDLYFNRTGKIMDTSLVHSLRRCVSLVAVLLVCATAVHAGEIQPGEILALDAVGGTNGAGALFIVNPKNGKRSILSDFGDAAQGPLGNGDLDGVVVGPDKIIYVSAIFSGTDGNGAIFKVHPKTGNRTIAVDFGHGDLQGALGYGLAEDASGRLLGNLESGTAPSFAVVRVNPKTSDRVLVSDFNNPAQGQTSQLINDIALGRHPGKAVFVSTEITLGHAALFRVNYGTGKRILLSDFANSTQGTDQADLLFASGLAEVRGQILVNSSADPYASRDQVLSIDPQTGDRTVLSDFDDPSEGTTGTFLHGLVIEKSGHIIVAAGPSGDLVGTILFRINPATGKRIVFSDSNNSAQGPAFQSVIYLVIEP